MAHNTDIKLTRLQESIRAIILETLASPLPRRVLIVVSGIDTKWIELGSGVTTAFLVSAVDAPSPHTVIVSHDKRHSYTRCKKMSELFIDGKYNKISSQIGLRFEPQHICWTKNNTPKRVTFVHAYSMMPFVGAMVLADLPFGLKPELMTTGLHGLPSDTRTFYLWPNTTHLDLIVLGKKLLDPTTHASQHTHVTSVVSNHEPSAEQIQQWTAAGWTVVNARERVKDT